jgi:cytochrome c2
MTRQPSRAHLLVLAMALGAAGCGSTATMLPGGGDADRGASLMEAYGCGACHTIPGLRGADAHVGPDLGDFAERRSIAGSLPNTPGNLVRWLENPQRVEPGTLMPDLDVPEAAARDIAAYLYAH